MSKKALLKQIELQQQFIQVQLADLHDLLQALIKQMESRNGS